MTAADSQHHGNVFDLFNNENVNYENWKNHIPLNWLSQDDLKLLMMMIINVQIAARIAKLRTSWLNHWPLRVNRKDWMLSWWRLDWWHAMRLTIKSFDHVVNYSHTSTQACQRRNIDNLPCSWFWTFNYFSTYFYVFFFSLPFSLSLIIFIKISFSLSEFVFTFRHKCLYFKGIAKCNKCLCWVVSIVWWH